ncbi:GNAT family N-acetyltransferase [Pseudoxanthomonas dokdonensis]|uniref:N-acetyltransferase domain-containing protein n=1 Tax=Pseudoxanthomonas dokdonensis TaxID=344882 RepID=A0A0R0CMP6_9GAMM|nr:GNAT family N-acetyltransferase [Pseudoxanthomonas dokdonensis]KRG67370.1 hypothetical protein ABB29_15695 [Pseudoxanthomonas dokdonensis]
MDITIRGPADNELEQVAVLFDAYRQFYGQATDIDRACQFLRERQQRHQSVLIVAEVGGEIIGFTQLYPMYSSVQTAPLFILNDLYVQQNFRRQGIGRLLLDAAAVASSAAGATRLMLETGSDNLAAQSLYRAAGWREESSQWYSLPLAALPD